MDIKLILEQFNKYVSKYDLKNPYIYNKLEHSYNVMKQSEILSNRLNLSNNEVILATVIGLLHDIGRFEQVKNYKTKNDYKIDHAVLGDKVLFDDNLIDKFKIPVRYNSIISFAILNHNKFCIEDTNNSEQIFFTQILRDSNAIDIFRASIDKKKISKKTYEPHVGISPKIDKLFFENSVINTFDVVNKNELVLAKISYIFDMNFSESLKILDEENILDFYESKVYTDKEYKPYIDHVKKYIKVKIN